MKQFFLYGKSEDGEDDGGEASDLRQHVDSLEELGAKLLRSVVDRIGYRPLTRIKELCGGPYVICVLYQQDKAYVRSHYVSGEVLSINGGNALDLLDWSALT